MDTSASIVPDQLKYENSKLDLSYEVDRLKSLTNCPLPLSDAKKDDLASLGFFYSMSENVIMCAYCEQKLQDLDSLEDCLNHSCSGKHVDSDEGVQDLQCSSEDSFSDISEDSDDILLVEKSAQKSWLDEIGVEGNTAPKCPDFMKHSDRLKSYKRWSSQAQNPDVLSDAGFFYTGLGDRTACFHCGGGLKDWKVTDDPWTEHAHWFPNCKYVLNVKGEEFARNAWMGKIGTSSKQEIDTATETIQNLLSIFQQKNSMREKPNSAADSLAPKPSRSSVCDKESSMLCQICFGKERDILFSPCNHIVSCSLCAKHVKRCVICRKIIRSKVKVFHA